MKKNHYLSGAAWGLTAFFISSINDLLSKKFGMRLGGANILFFRFLFSALTLLPFVLAQPARFATRQWKIHALRGGLFTLAMLPWSYGLIELPLPLVTTIGFTTPLFVIILAKLFLGEAIGWQRAGATVCGFIGIMISAGFSLKGINGWIGLALLATALFAVLDIVNKRLLMTDEGILPMMFFSAVWTSIFTAPLAALTWQTPTWQELGALVVLGCGANVLLGCLLKAYALCEVSAIQPLRYMEFLFSCALSILFFNEAPTTNVLIGVCLIIPTTAYLSYTEAARVAKKWEMAKGIP